MSCHRHSLKDPTLDPDYDDGWYSTTRAQTIVEMLFIFPKLVRNTEMIERLACWALKNANRTAKALTNPIGGMEARKEGLFSTRLAVDYLLAQTGIGCSELEDAGVKGFCCIDWTKNATTEIE